MGLRGPKPQGFVRISTADAAPEVIAALRDMSKETGWSFNSLHRAALVDFAIDAGYLASHRREDLIGFFPRPERTK